MKKKIAKRVIELLITLVTITFLSFLLVYLAPSDAAVKMLNSQGFVVSDETLNAVRERLGLNDNVFVQYINWFGGVLQGDLGESFRTGRPVINMLLPALVRTLKLAGLTMLITVAVSIPVGIRCARYRDGRFDRVVRYVTYAFASLPSFFIGFIVLWLVAGKLGWIPVSMSTSKNILQLLVPATVLAFGLVSWMIRQVRTAFLERLSDGFAVGLRACGIPDKTIFRSYVLRAALPQIITALGICLGSVLAGAVLVENVFSWPGLGQTVMTAINYQDYPVLQGFTIWIALAYFVINILIDVFSAMADPRIRLGDGSDGKGRGYGNRRKGGSRRGEETGRDRVVDASADRAVAETSLADMASAAVASGGMMTVEVTNLAEVVDDTLTESPEGIASSSAKAPVDFGISTGSEEVGA